MRVEIVGALVLLVGLQVAAVPAAQSAGPRIAVTIDDLPWNGRTQPGEDVEQVTRRLLDTLITRGVPAVGFVNCARTRADDPVLLAWQRAGMELGNHGSNHLDLDKSDVAEWINDVRACHQMLTSALGAPDRFFRFPFGHQGASDSRRSAAAEALRSEGYRIGHFTIDNSEWILAEAYGRALVAGDSRRREEISAAYVEHMSDALAHFMGVSQSVAGRDVPHVLLLHANALAADHFGRVLDAYRAQGAVFITLSEALADPIYLQPDQYVGPKGFSWLYRLDPTGTRSAQLWDEQQASRFERDYGR